MSGIPRADGGAARRGEPFLSRHRFSIALIGGVFWVAWTFLIQGFVVTVRFEAAQPGLFRVYWQDADSGFRTGKENAVRYEAGVHEIRIPIDGFGRGGKLRLDPLEGEGTVRVHGVELDGAFAKPVSWTADAPGAMETIRPEGDWEEILSDDEGGVLLVSGGTDPQLIWEGLVWERVFLSEPLPWLLVLFALAVIAAENRCPALADAASRRFAFVPVLLLVALAGHLSIALDSTRGIHPDEAAHLSAARYYETHWLVPRPDDPTIRESYSRYGASRLNTEEIAYWLAGKFSALTAWTGVELPHQRVRLFNVFLFGLITICTALSVRCRLIALPLLLTPQAGYLFAYFNSDAFALAVGFLLFFSVAGAVSPAGRLFGGRPVEKPLGPILLGAAFAFLTGLLKPNFWLLGGFALGYLLVRLWFVPAGRRTVGAVAVAVFAVSAVAAHFLWIFVAEWRADFEREERVQEARMATAVDKFNPRTPLEELADGLYLRERGKSLRYLFEERRWHEIAFATSFGSYGFFSVRPSPLYFERLRPIALVFAVAFLFPALFRLRSKEALLFAGGIFSAAAILSAAVYFSWNHDFQAQGRYLAPVLPILGVLLYECRKRFSPWFLGVPMVALVVLAFYSYWFVAVPGLR